MQVTSRAPQLLTGELWQQMSAEAKVAFVWGVGNLVDLDAAQAGTAGASEWSSIPTLVRGLRGTPINEVVRYVDAFYATHQGELDRPVIDAIFQTVVLPALRGQEGGEKKAVTGRKPQ